MHLLSDTRINRQEMTAIEQAISHLELHFSEKISAYDLSDLFHIPLKKLQAGFKRKVGFTIHDYLSSVRLSHAKTFLAGEDALKCIPYKVGYRSSSHFGQFFKKLVGITPAEYRFSQQQ